MMDFIFRYIIITVITDIFNHWLLLVQSSDFLSFNIILQTIMLYLLYNIYTSVIMYYTVFYLLLQTVVAGLMLMYYSMDLFSAFLFLAEFVIIFICILLIFYLNVYGNANKVLSYIFLKKNFFLLIPVFFNLTNNIYSEIENYSEFLLNSSLFYENYYYHLNNKSFNDFYGLYISIFNINSIPTIIIAYLLLVGSFIAVNIHINTKSFKVLNYSDFFIMFDLFKDFSKFIFMRKQNLTDQLHTTSSTRFFKKKFE